jgi:hypothetical protein
MKRVLYTPIFEYPADYFTGDNLSHFLPAKLLWYKCNILKEGFYEPVYGLNFEDEVEITFAFYESQPLCNYFSKPEWISKFIILENSSKVKGLSQDYDFFVNQYRYRGARPPELNSGFSPVFVELNQPTVAATHEAVFRHKIYADDLRLSLGCQTFIEEIYKNINPGRRRLIGIHHRGGDPWSRHAFNSMGSNEKLLAQLKIQYQDAVIILLGEGWGRYGDSSIVRLDDYINKDTIRDYFGYAGPDLKYILQAYFSNYAELLFISISGFSLFIESIRPKSMIPPIPIFWRKEVFEGDCTFILKMRRELGWGCAEFDSYRLNNKWDAAYQTTVHHFLYYSRKPELLEGYCLNNPNTLDNINKLLKFYSSDFPPFGVSYYDFRVWVVLLRIRFSILINTFRSFSRYILLPPVRAALRWLRLLYRSHFSLGVTKSR